MDLVNEPQDLLRPGRAGGPAQDRSVVRVDQDCGAVGELHHPGQIALPGNLHGADARGGKFPFDFADELLLSHLAGADGDIPEPWMQPVIDISFERHYASGEAENDEEDCRYEPKIEMCLEDRVPRSHRFTLEIPLPVRAPGG